MKKILFLAVMCSVLLLSQQASAACYITPTSDYICDSTTPTSGGQTVQRDTQANVPGSPYVFQTTNVRSQYGWLPGVLANLGMLQSPGPSGPHPPITGGQASGVGTAQWSGAECEPGRDAKEQFKAHVLSREGYRNCSYYDSTGSNCPYTGPSAPAGNCPTAQARAECNRGGCLTIGVGHLVRRGEPYGPQCCTCISDAEVMALYDSDIDTFWNAVASHMNEACIPNEGCFAVAVGSVLYQGGTNFLRGTFSRRWGQIVNGQYGAASAGLENSIWAGQSPNRVADFQAALQAMQARVDAGEALGCGSGGGGGTPPPPTP